jgi:hypothetical protein
LVELATTLEKLNIDLQAIFPYFIDVQNTGPCRRESELDKKVIFFFAADSNSREGDAKSYCRQNAEAT